MCVRLLSHCWCASQSLMAVWLSAHATACSQVVEGHMAQLQAAVQHVLAVLLWLHINIPHTSQQQTPGLLLNSLYATDRKNLGCALSFQPEKEKTVFKILWHNSKIRTLRFSCENQLDNLPDTVNRLPSLEDLSIMRNGHYHTDHTTQGLLPTRLLPCSAHTRS